MLNFCELYIIHLFWQVLEGLLIHQNLCHIKLQTLLDGRYLHLDIDLPVAARIAGSFCFFQQVFCVSGQLCANIKHRCFGNLKSPSNTAKKLAQ